MAAIAAAAAHCGAGKFPACRYMRNMRKEPFYLRSAVATVEMYLRTESPRYR